ncbi:MAG: hypothetical protein IJR60_01120 [Eubacterium sp.]|nr:hypothetical protein [Eubacterium sp.]
MRILIGSPIKQKSTVLKEFLIGLDEADKANCEVTYFFVDDNTEESSSELLSSFAKLHDVIIKNGSELFDVTPYTENDDYQKHNWKSVNLAKVTVYKNAMINYCIDEKYDYLFLIDSDIIIDKRTFPQLISDDVEIVSNVFWNQWRRNGFLTPQCFFIPDIYVQDKAFNIPYTPEEAHIIHMENIERMKTPGLHAVDGLGACTLIKRSALEKGVSFAEIYNLKIPGEDRPFCIRAGVAGIQLYMDTHFPAYHCSKEIFLDRVDEYKRDGWKFDMCQVFEPEVPKKKMNFVLKFIYRASKKIVREFRSKYQT